MPGPMWKLTESSRAPPEGQALYGLTCIDLSYTGSSNALEFMSFERTLLLEISQILLLKTSREAGNKWLNFKLPIQCEEVICKISSWPHCSIAWKHPARKCYPFNLRIKLENGCTEEKANDYVKTWNLCISACSAYPEMLYCMLTIMSEHKLSSSDTAKGRYLCVR